MALCPVCGTPGFLGIGDKPDQQWCAEHYPGPLPAAYRARLIRLMRESPSSAPPPPPEVAPKPRAEEDKWVRICVIRGCGKPARPGVERLCEEHYAPVSDAVVNRHIANVLAGKSRSPVVEAVLENPPGDDPDEEAPG